MRACSLVWLKRLAHNESILGSNPSRPTPARLAPRALTQVRSLLYSSSSATYPGQVVRVGQLRASRSIHE